MQSISHSRIAHGCQILCLYTSACCIMHNGVQGSLLQGSTWLLTEKQVMVRAAAAGIVRQHASVVGGLAQASIVDRCHLVSHPLQADGPCTCCSGQWPCCSHVLPRRHQQPRPPNQSPWGAVPEQTAGNKQPHMLALTAATGAHVCLSCSGSYSLLQAG